MSSWPRVWNSRKRATWAGRCGGPWRRPRGPTRRTPRISTRVPPRSTRRVRVERQRTARWSPSRRCHPGRGGPDTAPLSAWRAQGRALRRHVAAEGAQSAPEHLHVVLDLAQAPVGGEAEDAPDLPGGVVVVDVRGGLGAADGADTALSADHLVDIG